MTDRKAFVDKVAAQLKQWDDEIQKLEIKAQKAGSGAKAEYKKQIQELRKKKASAQDRLEDIKDAGEEAWGKVKFGAEKALDEIKNVFQAVLSKFK